MSGDRRSVDFNHRRAQSSQLPALDRTRLAFDIADAVSNRTLTGQQRTSIGDPERMESREEDDVILHL